MVGVNKRRKETIHMVLKGVDVHPSYQKGFPFRKDLIDFAIVKVTEGTSVMTGSAAMVEQARANGLLFGVYHFMTKADPVAQANKFVDSIANWIGKGILAVDWEQYGVTTGDNLWAFVNRVHERTGVWPVIYTNQYDAAKISGAAGDKVRQNCGLWYANWPWGSRITEWKDANHTGGLKDWVMPLWQFGVFSAAGANKLLGYNGDVDVDYFYGDAETWMKYAAGSGQVQAPPTGEPQKPGPSEPGLDESFYIVQKGDTLSGIAAKFGTTYQVLAALNGIANPNLIYPGTKLRVNGAAITQPAVQTYTVQKGDTLSGIAAKYGTTWQKLQSINGIKNANLIHPGQVLKLA